MKICVVGSGYVGLVTSAGLSETGTQVVCADVDADRVARLSRGDIPIYEPGLNELVARNTEERRLIFSSDVPDAIAHANIVFIAVGTPMRSDGSADLSAVDAVAKTVADHVTQECILVVKSTVPVGTNARLQKTVAHAPHRIHVVSNPEFLKEGDAISDFMRPDRIVIGVAADDDFSKQRMARLYHPLSLASDRIIWMDPASAELTKYVANTMLAMRISFMNEVAEICEKVGANVHAVRRGVGSDTRIGSQFLHAGPGYGGSCLPKDVNALIHTAREHGVDLELAMATDQVNRRQKGILLRKVRAILGDTIRGKKVCVWGIAFKPRTDDLRESPALTLIDGLLADGALVAAHDPQAMDNARAMYGDRISFAADPYEAARDADVLVLATEWRAYQNPNFDKIREHMKQPNLVDGRNIWSKYALEKQGFRYVGIGV